jgi:hypothetical protein
MILTFASRGDRRLWMHLLKLDAERPRRRRRTPRPGASGAGA